MTAFDHAVHQYNTAHADDDLDSYDPYKREQQLREQYRIAEQKFSQLVKELHVPFLDAKLYRKYFIQQKTASNLQCLLSITECLQAHKQQTLKLLKLIFEREQIVHNIKLMAFDYAQGKLSTLEAQTKVLQLLYALQQVTVHIVEGIDEWRKRLTRPYPFEWRGINYIFKIIKDCQFIDTCDLKSVLPFLSLSSHPLCANLNSLNLFGPQQIGSANGAPSSIAITYPMKPTTKKSVVPSVSPEFQQRLKRGEMMIFAEYHQQVNLLKELTAKHSAGTFLTVLSVKHIIPNCADGIRLNNKAWDKRLQRALTQAFRKLQTKLDETEAAAKDLGHSASPMAMMDQTNELQQQQSADDQQTDDQTEKSEITDNKAADHTMNSSVVSGADEHSLTTSMATTAQDDNATTTTAGKDKLAQSTTSDQTPPSPNTTTETNTAADTTTTSSPTPSKADEKSNAKSETDTTTTKPDEAASSTTD
eukprot:TRINITY_DN4027_c0_g1_i1.p1 TRINITY_DN4027_c0_g1~~TRINITY_DN4027_c0_g1_i1.p1  ORF type:complete len:475 (-),score=65.22 TRINITY_DN4027_c0_g1_i1:43-1467(-)